MSNRLPEKLRNLKRLKGYGALAAGLVILLTFVVFAVFPAQIAPHNPETVFEPFLAPCAEHPLGTNNIGRDIMSETIYAARSTLAVGLLAAVVSLVIGTLIGLAAGYLGSIAGEAVNGVVNFFLLIPMLPLAIVLAAYLGAGWHNVVLTVALLGWCGTARAVRQRTLQLKKMPFVEIMKGLGYSRTRILFGHILPNLREIVLAKFVTGVASCVLLEATLGFLGLGDVTDITWGGMINLAYRHGGFSSGAYNWFIAPGVCIMLLVLAFYLINYFIETRANAVKGGASYLD